MMSQEVSSIGSTTCLVEEVEEGGDTARDAGDEQDTGRMNTQAHRLKDTATDGAASVTPPKMTTAPTQQQDERPANADDMLSDDMDNVDAELARMLGLLDGILSDETPDSSILANSASTLSISSLSMSSALAGLSSCC